MRIGIVVVTAAACLMMPGSRVHGEEILTPVIDGRLVAGRR